MIFTQLLSALFIASSVNLVAPSIGALCGWAAGRGIEDRIELQRCDTATTAAEANDVVTGSAIQDPRKDIMQICEGVLSISDIYLNPDQEKQSEVLNGMKTHLRGTSIVKRIWQYAQKHSWHLCSKQYKDHGSSHTIEHDNTSFRDLVSDWVRSIFTSPSPDYSEASNMIRVFQRWCKSIYFVKKEYVSDYDGIRYVSDADELLGQYRSVVVKEPFLCLIVSSVGGRNWIELLSSYNDELFLVSQLAREVSNIEWLNFWHPDLLAPTAEANIFSCKDITSAEYVLVGCNSYAKLIGGFFDSVPFQYSDGWIERSGRGERYYSDGEYKYKAFIIAIQHKIVILPIIQACKRHYSDNIKVADVLFYNAGHTKTAIGLEQFSRITSVISRAMIEVYKLFAQSSCGSSQNKDQIVRQMLYRTQCCVPGRDTSVPLYFGIQID